MPKDTARRGSLPSRPSFKRLATAAPEREAAASPTLSSLTQLPFPVPRGYRRNLPSEFFDHLNRKREAGQPHRYTTRDVKAIISFVSPKPNRDTTQYLRDTVDRAVKAGQPAARPALPPRPLIERIERPSLAERISEARASATYKPVAKRPALPDFKSLGSRDSFLILKPQVAATYNRLIAPFERTHLFDGLPEKTKDHLIALNDDLLAFDDWEHTPVAAEKWQSLRFGLKAIGNISFAGLEQNYRKICSALAIVHAGGYFDWLRKPPPGPHFSCARCFKRPKSGRNRRRRLWSKRRPP